MNLCKESELRFQMTDEEFWNHVYYGPWHVPPVDGDDEDWLDGSYDETSQQWRRCLECGATAECGRDEEDRPWTHAVGTALPYSEIFEED